MTLVAIAIIFIPVGLFFSYTIGYLLALSAQKTDETEHTFRTSSLLSNANDPIFFHEMDTIPETIERIKESFEQIQEFSVNASHELRTPLTIIRGEVELALRSLKQPEEYQQVLSSILEEVYRLSNIIDDLLLIAKTQMGQITLDHQPLNLQSLIEEIADEADMFTAQAGIRFSKGAIAPAMVLGDMLRIRRVFLNLIDNAVKYNKPKGSISLSLTTHDGNAYVSIKDTGIGIPPESLNQIFERFYKVPTRLTVVKDSTGLGLYIVKWIVESHDGEVLVESALGIGSEFTVRLPLIDPGTLVPS
jgi:signal transduction histidine kinase